MISVLITIDSFVLFQWELHQGGDLAIPLLYLPLANQLFHTAPISPEAWFRIISTAIIVSMTVGTEKWIHNRLTP